MREGGGGHGGGKKGLFPPPMNPSALPQFLCYDHKIFFGRKHVRYVIGDKKKLANFTIGRFYKRLKIVNAQKQAKTGKKWHMFDPMGLPLYWHIWSGIFWVMTLGISFSKNKSTNIIYILISIFRHFRQKNFSIFLEFPKKLKNFFAENNEKSKLRCI